MTYRHWPLICLLLFFVQGAMLPFWWPGVHLPDLWLVTIILLTFFDGPKLGLPVAVCGALAQDIIVGNFFGLHMVGYVLAVLATIPAWNHLQIRYSLVFIVVFAVSLLAGVGQYVMLALAGEAIYFWSYAVQAVLPSAALNTFFSLVLYPLLRQREGDV